MLSQETISYDSEDADPRLIAFARRAFEWRIGEWIEIPIGLVAVVLDGGRTMNSFRDLFQLAGFEDRIRSFIIRKFGWRLSATLGRISGESLRDYTPLLSDTLRDPGRGSILEGLLSLILASHRRSHWSQWRSWSISKGSSKDLSLSYSGSSPFLRYKHNSISFRSFSINSGLISPIGYSTYLSRTELMEDLKLLEMLSTNATDPGHSTHSHYSLNTSAN